ncbi:hypothetical protein AVEN_268640-1 [Araneus ventricosus]|uniref:Gustatory receptor n=1 Tax=Araneus ventricosus TaxID=182803 RepID=A0A4Y2T9R3_ARAVE|nr:hypothetical protein AVEN_102426-1 [Araneus ventricosus]GBN96553.1 hypothetical protein AVEN_268640-1 [Araneus ventricosus]
MNRSAIKSIYNPHQTNEALGETKFLKRQNERIEYRLVKVFRLVFILFYIVGIELPISPKRRKNRYPRTHRRDVRVHKILSYCRKCPKYFVFFFLIVIEMVWDIINLEDKRTAATHFLLVVLTLILLISIHKSRRAMFRMTQMLSEVFKSFPSYNLNLVRYLSHALLVSSVTVSVYLAIVFNFRSTSLSYTQKRKFCENNEVTVFLNLQSYCFVTLQTIGCLIHAVGSILFSLFSIFYSLVCILVQVLLSHLLNKINKANSTEKLHKPLFLFAIVSRIMNCLEDSFSSAVFLETVMSMVGMFRAGYILVFLSCVRLDYLPLMFFGIVVFVHQLLIMISASTANEKAALTMKSLSCRIPESETDMRFKLRRISGEHKSLSVWKIYVLDRSLVVTSVGTLLTYGILIGTIGKVS